MSMNHSSKPSADTRLIPGGRLLWIYKKNQISLVDQPPSTGLTEPLEALLQDASRQRALLQKLRLRGNESIKP